MNCVELLFCYYISTNHFIIQSWSLKIPLIRPRWKLHWTNLKEENNIWDEIYRNPMVGDPRSNHLILGFFFTVIRIPPLTHTWHKRWTWKPIIFAITLMPDFFLTYNSHHLITYNKYNKLNIDQLFLLPASSSLSIILSSTIKAIKNK